MENENKLAVIVKDSGLEPTKAQFILEKFQDYFNIAAEWEAKAKTIIVKDETQKADMQMARVGRLFLRDKRLAIEKSRKELKEQALREGKAIDGIANVLKALIVPIEEYLDKQERFVEIRAAEKAEQERIAMEKRIEDERIAKEKAEAEERERIRLENERLKVEAIEKEKQLTAERAKAEAEKKAAEENARKEREALEAAARVEREKQARAFAEQKAKDDAERKAIEEKARKEREAERAKAEKERLEKEKLQQQLKNLIECPKCHHKFSRANK